MIELLGFISMILTLYIYVLIAAAVMQTKVILQVLQRAGVAGPDQNLPASVRAKHGTNRNGKTVHYYLN